MDNQSITHTRWNCTGKDQDSDGWIFGRNSVGGNRDVESKN